MRPREIFWSALRSSYHHSIFRSLNNRYRADYFDVQQAREWSETLFVSTEELVENHFFRWRDLGHIVQPGVARALDRLGGRPATIVELGTAQFDSRDFGGGTSILSTLLFDSYVRSFGGTLWSVDIRDDPSRSLAGITSEATKFLIVDSTEFLQDPNNGELLGAIDLMYFDSLELDLSEPQPAMLKISEEWSLAQPLFSPEAVAVITQSPRTPNDLTRPSEIRRASNFQEKYGFMPSRAHDVKIFLAASHHWRVLHHASSLVVQKTC